MSLLRNLQQKPEPARMRFVVVITSLITLFVVVLWIPTLGPRLREQTDGDTTKAPSPVSSFIGVSRSFFSNISYEAEKAVEITSTKEEEIVGTRAPSGATESSTTTDEDILQ